MPLLERPKQGVLSFINSGGLKFVLGILRRQVKLVLRSYQCEVHIDLRQQATAGQVYSYSDTKVSNGRMEEMR